jgi:hypothetical protein
MPCPHIKSTGRESLRDCLKRLRTKDIRVSALQLLLLAVTGARVQSQNPTVFT